MRNSITMPEIHRLFKIHFCNMQDVKLIPYMSVLQSLNAIFSYLYIAQSNGINFAVLYPHKQAKYSVESEIFFFFLFAYFTKWVQLKNTALWWNFNDESSTWKLNGHNFFL